MINQLYGYLNDSIVLMAGWLASPALWKLWAATLGFVLMVSIIVLIIKKLMNPFNLTPR